MLTIDVFLAYNSGICIITKILQNYSTFINHIIQQHHLVCRLTLFISNFVSFSYFGGKYIQKRIQKFHVFLHSFYQWHWIQYKC